MEFSISIVPFREITTKNFEIFENAASGQDYLARSCQLSFEVQYRGGSGHSPSQPAGRTTRKATSPIRPDPKPIWPQPE